MKFPFASLGLLLSWLVPASAIAQVETVPPFSQANVCVVLGGQSNGVGAAEIGPANVMATAERNHILTLGGKWFAPGFDPSTTTEASYGGSLYPSMWPPNRRRAGRGILVSMVNKLTVLEPRSNVLVTNVSRGGQSITFFMPVAGTPWRAMTGVVKRMRMAGCGSLTVVWIQGEADAQNPVLANTWAENMVRLWAAMRAEWMAQRLIVVQLGDLPIVTNKETATYWEIVRQQQRLAVDRIGPAAVLVETRGLNKVEGPHYSADSYDVIGNLVALNIHALLPPASGLPATSLFAN